MFMIKRIVVMHLIPLLIFLPGVATAAGILSYELGTRDLGLAAAGWSARADDAATLFRNPAGMSRLEGPQATLGLQSLYADFAFEPDANTTPSGGYGGNPVGFFPSGSAFFVNSLPSGLGLGLGLFSCFGLAAEYDPGWVGRYYYQKGTLIGMSVMPAVSYQLNEWLSLGAGLNIMFGIFDQEVAIRNLTAVQDGKLEIDSSDRGLGGNFGILIEPNAKTRVGATYLTQVSLDFEDTPEYSGISPILETILTNRGILGAKQNLGMTVPQSVMVSFVREVCPGWNLMGNVGWQNWKEFGKVTIAVGDTVGSLTADKNYKDTWHGALGAEWQADPKWTLTGGIAYDSSPVDDADRTVDFITGKTWRFGGGARLAASDKVELGLAYTLAWMGDLPVDQYRGPLAGRVSGTFKASAIHFVGLNLEVGL